MSHLSPSKVYAALPTVGNKRQKTSVDTDENVSPLTNITLSDRRIQVSAVGEVTLPPDRSRLTIKVRSQKENVQDAKDSVTRRLDYIMQTLTNHGIKVLIHPLVNLFERYM